MRRAAALLCGWLACIGGSTLAMAQEEPAEPPAEEPAEPPAEEPAEPPTAKPSKTARTPLEQVRPGRPNFSDIYVVPYRSVLKRRRVEVMPTYNVTFNNPVVRHHGFGAMVNLYLSEALFVGVEGTYYVKDLTDRYNLLGVNQRVIPSANRYVWSAFLDFGYVPMYGKFTFFGSSIAHWELWVAAGVGMFQSEIIPRRCPTAPPGGCPVGSESFTNYLVSGMLPAIGFRMWLSRWFAFDTYVKNYIFADQYEPTNRSTDDPIDKVKGAAISQFTFNLVFGVGFSLMIPPGFQYKTGR